MDDYDSDNSVDSNKNNYRDYPKQNNNGGIKFKNIRKEQQNDYNLSNGA